jgi:hypothetical protein
VPRNRVLGQIWSGANLSIRSGEQKNKRRKPTKKIGPAAATEQDRVKTGEWKKLRSNDTKSKWCKTHSTNEIKKPTFPLKSKIEFLAH